MLFIKSTLAVIFILPYFLHGSKEFLEFVDVPGSSKDENVYLNDRISEVSLDAMSKSSRYIYFLGTNKLTTHMVRFSCKTASRSTPISNIQLCCRPDILQSRTCYSLIPKSKEGYISCGRTEIRYQYDILEGASYSLSFNPTNTRDFAHNGIISCSLSDADSLIESNEIEFRDATFYANQLGIQPGNTVQTFTSPITLFDFPLPFKCGNFEEKMTSWPSWISSVWDKLSPYEWGYCLVEGTNTPSVCASSASDINIGDGITTMDGTLFLLTPRLLQSHPDSALVCRMKLVKAPIRTFAFSSNTEGTPKILKGFSIDEKSRPLHPDELIPLSNNFTELVFVDGTYLNNFNLQAFYRKPANHTATFTWYKDGVVQAGNSAHEYSFRLPPRVERKIAGRYELVVSCPSSDDLRFVFILKVVGPPKFRNTECIYDHFYAMEGSSYAINCTLGAGKSEIKIGVNGVESQTPSGLRKSLESSLDFAIQTISRLKIDFSAIGEERNGKTILVNMEDLRPEQNFRLVIKAINENGQSQLAGTIRVVPKPILSIPPKQMSCERDCGTGTYRVHCIIKKSIISQWRDTLGLILVQDWLIDGTRTLTSVMKDPSISDYFHFNASNPTHIDISPLRPFSAKSDSNMTLQEVLESKSINPLPDLTIECRVRLYVANPRAEFKRITTSKSDMSRRRRSIADESTLIYDSHLEEDSVIKSLLQAKRHYGVTLEQPAMAGLSWILAVVISLIIVISVIGLSLWVCTKNRGESYNAYQKELKVGNDPLMELKGNCSFQPFERPEGPPIIVNRCSLDEESVHFGSDDDGELDDYNLDPRTFNEEASYIGQYVPRSIPDTQFPHNLSMSSGHQTAV